MKKDAYYFSHDSNSKDDPKCVLLIEQLGLEGYGIFWILVETLRDQPGYKYPLALLPAIARRYNSTTQKVETVVKSYDLFQITEDEFFFSISLMDRMEYLEISRQQRVEAGKKSAEKRKLLQISNERSTAVQRENNDRSTSKVKESKEKESKEKESKDKNIIEDDLFTQALNEFKKMRKLIKKPMTDRAVSLTLANLNKLSTNENEQILILNQSIANSWQGVFPLKEGKNGGTRQNNGTSEKQSNTESEGDRLARRAVEKFGQPVEDTELEF
ncbi:MAG: Lin1244/Lin1753 domain-containing protein [Clostridium sp.]|uniref:Lin1244/Lin1753 domain-containing protein n=1 Tax=Clostridium sp. TaxID=1506 RepID=UPI003D6D81F1